jgi:hypothetical protein
MDAGQSGSLTEFKGVLYAGTLSTTMFVPVNSAVYQSKDGKHWKKVSQDGFGDPVHNTTIGEMVVFRDRLYVGTGDMGGTAIAQLWRTGNGVTWEAVDTVGFGDLGNFFLSSLTVYRGTLYGVAWNSGKGIQIYRSPTGNPGSWTKATTIFDDPANAGQWHTGFITYNDMLYMAVEGSAGVGVYRSRDGSTWTAVTPGGFGGSPLDGTGSFAIYKDQLYFSASNWATAGTIWRTLDGKNWSNVIDGGFGDANNWKVEALISYAGDLYATTTNWVTGSEVWRTGDGQTWEQVNQDGFTGSCSPWTPEPCNWGGFNGSSAFVFKQGLYVGTWNPFGGEIWKLEPGH